MSRRREYQQTLDLHTSRSITMPTARYFMRASRRLQTGGTLTDVESQAGVEARMLFAFAGDTLAAPRFIVSEAKT